MPPKKRSRTGCHSCKQSRVKCDEVKPRCGQCIKLNRDCDYTLVLKWGGRPYKSAKVEKLNVVDQMSRRQLERVLDTPSEKQKARSGSMVHTSSSVITFRMETPYAAPPKRKGLDPAAKVQAHEDISCVKANDLIVQTVGKGSETPKTFAFLDDLLTSNLQEWPSLHTLPVDETTPRESNLSSSPLDLTLEYDAWNRPHNGFLISKPFIDMSPVKMSPSSSVEEIEPIPRGLVPLPDILLNVPFYYESFKFYMDSTTSILTPADNSIYIDNPFKIVLPKLAMANDGLMSLLVAFGVWHKAALEGDMTKDSLVESLIDRALKELFKLLSDKETSTSDMTLALVMLLSSFTVFTLKNNFHWKIHMKGAKQIFLNRGYDKPFNKLLVDTSYTHSVSSMRPKLLYFLIRWFAYIDIFTDLSSPLTPAPEEIARAKASPSPHIVTTNDTNKMDYDFDDVPGSLISLESHENIDYMLGFNLKIIPVLSHLCSLIKCVNLLEALGQMPPPAVNETALMVQQQLNHFQFTIFVPNSTPNYKSINHLIASNQCFLYMGTLQLYTRVLKIDRSSQLIQSICDKMKVLIENYIDTTTPNSITLILPLFIAGCESLDERLRTFYLSKLIDLKIKGAINADCAMELMQISWETSSNWWEVMTILNKNVVFI